MPNTQELIEKYKAEMQKLISNKTKNKIAEEIKEEIIEKIEDFPKFENSKDALDKRIDEILEQNADVVIKGDARGEGAFSQRSVETIDDIQRIVSGSCIRGGEKAKYSPPANTGSRKGDNDETELPLTDFGNLQIEVFAANRAYPIENAIIRIKSFDKSSLVAILVTNQNGISESVRLATPNKALSQTPAANTPFADYFADISAAGYTPMVDIPIQMFGGINSVLPANLIPSEEM